MIVYCLLTLLPATPHYWKDTRIHNLGNVGFRGGIHAALAPLSTRIIDRIAYSGRDIRSEILHNVTSSPSRTVDLCCGVGLSTCESSLGVDTSPQMISMAKWLHKDRKEFTIGNAETWGDTDAFDMATCFFAMHEMPHKGRVRVLKNMLRIANRALIVDISQSYVPSRAMLSGEPFVLDYLANIDDDIHSIANVAITKSNIIPKHVTSWFLEKDSNK